MISILKRKESERLNRRVSLSVVVCTRNRNAAVLDTIRHVRLGDDEEREIIVVDQSDDSRTREALRSEPIQSPVRYVHMPPLGLSAARNNGVRQARGEIILMTDDDCLPADNWLEAIQETFEAYPQVGLVFTNVLAERHDTRQGFVPAYYRSNAELVECVRRKHRAEGIGASMAFRRSVWSAVEGFDELLGAGGRFQSAEETDFALRVLQSGFSICETPHTYVIHRGFRTWQQSPDLVRGYLRGIGATYAKHLRSGRFSAIYPLIHLFLRWSFGAPVVDLGRTPSRLLRLRAFLQCAWEGIRTEVDPRHAKFVGQQQPESTAKTLSD